MSEHEIDQTFAGEVGDAELLARGAAGDADAQAELLGRHRAAVELLPGAAAYPFTEMSGQQALAWRPGAGRPDLPFRAVWLALHAQSLVPISVPAEHRQRWAAYLQLSAAQRLAVWHHEVEGQRLREIAVHLGLDLAETSALLCGAYANLRRSVAMLEETSCDTAQELIDRYRFAPLAGDAGPEPSQLWRRPPHCAECDRLVAVLLGLETGLRPVLAETVLGSRAAGYLARRPRPRTLVTALPRLTVPVRALVAALGVASVAAVVAIVVVPTVVAPPPAPDGVAQAGAALPGTFFRPDRSIAVRVRPAGSRATSRTAVPVSAVSGQSSSSGSPVPPSGEAGTSGTSTSPVEPTPVTPPPQPPTQPPRPGDGGPVTVSTGDHAVTVTVDPAPLPVDPVVVQVPLPVTGH